MSQDYKSPTLGLEYELFCVGQARDAAEFEEVKKKLARYVDVYFKLGASDAHCTVENLEVQDLHKPKHQQESATAV